MRVIDITGRSAAFSLTSQAMFVVSSLIREALVSFVSCDKDTLHGIFVGYAIVHHSSLDYLLNGRYY